MVNVLAVVGLGFVLGMRHATDPDHVIAVSTIVTRQRSVRHAGLIGALWGVGHTVTIFAVGILIILFRVTIPPRIGLTMELIVGFMLILLGVLNLTGVLQWITHRFTPGHHHHHPDSEPAVAHSHAHQHDGSAHQHIHQHAIAPNAAPSGFGGRLLERLGLYQLLRPLAIGLIHGMAGSAAVALLVLAEIRNPHWAVAYLLVFGVGTIAGMMLITLVIGTPFAWAGGRSARLNRGMAVASGLLSVAFGLFITAQIAFTDGLFSAHPHWTPQ